MIKAIISENLLYKQWLHKNIKIKKSSPVYHLQTAKLIRGELISKCFRKAYL